MIPILLDKILLSLDNDQNVQLNIFSIFIISPNFGSYKFHLNFLDHWLCETYINNGTTTSVRISWDRIFLFLDSNPKLSPSVDLPAKP